MDEEYFLERNLFPHLDDDPYTSYEPDFEEAYHDPEYYCPVCDCGCDDEYSVCPDCGHDPNSDTH